MVDIEYWVDTVLSKPDEYAALAVTAVAFGWAALQFSDARDPTAVLLGGLLLAVLLGAAGSRIAGEWHYWAGGGLLAGVLILVVDTSVI